MEETRRVMLKSRPEKFLCASIVFLIIGTYLFELLIILPKLYPNSNNSTWHKGGHIVAGTWILVNLLLSFWKFVSINPGSGSKLLPSVLKPGWRYCWKCEANFPPRSHHCFNCNTCILVRDHHCVIGSNCVGYTTRRYFMQMNLYFWLALLYANLLNIDFVWELYHDLQYRSLLTMFMPLLAWLFGITKGETLLMAIFTSFCVISFLYSTAVILFHMKNTLKGRTTHEVSKNVGTMYDLGITRNLQEAFGLNWKIAWICPLIPSPLPGDGISFVEKEFIEQSGKNL